MGSLRYSSLFRPPRGDRADELPNAHDRPLFTNQDWLLDASKYVAEVYRSKDGKSLVLENGLIQRVIRLSPNATAIALEDLRTGSSLLCSVPPEAIMKLDGQEYKFGGLAGQSNHAFLDPATIESPLINR